MISPLAYVDPEAKLGKNVEIKPFAYDYGESWFSVAGDVDDFIFYEAEGQEKISSER